MIIQGRVGIAHTSLFHFSRIPLRLTRMKHYIGIFLQFIVLVFLPLLVIWQLNFGFSLIWMPGLTLGGIIVFTIGTKLRE